MKKRVIAYLHTHWDLEWYREFEVFRLRLIRVIDDVLELLESGEIPSFYFDGQVCALLDYLEFRPEKETLIRQLIKEKRFFIGPFYTLVDEFLIDKNTFYKNLEIGIKISKDFGCEDFIGYLADTFGHSRNVSKAFKYFGIDKCMVWRGVGDLPSEFVFNGINTVNLIRGYFNDIFTTNKSLEEKAQFVKKELDLIAEKSGNTILMAIGGDHLGIPKDINHQIQEVNKYLSDYEIELSNPFEYFKAVKYEFKEKFDGELRDNSKTFILPGSYSARRDLKQLRNKCSYKLKLAEDFSKKCNVDYSKPIEYAYKLLLRNNAHDGICGCSTDDTHKDNISRYRKILQISETIIEELKSRGFKFSLSGNMEICKSPIVIKDTEILSKETYVDSQLLYDTQKVPVTEDFSTIYTLLKEKIPTNDTLTINKNIISNKFVKLEVKENNLIINAKYKVYFTRQKDLGDSYNFAPDIKSKPEIAKILDTKIKTTGKYRCTLEVKTNFFSVEISLNKGSELLNFKIKWNNRYKNKLWQVRFELENPVEKTYSEDMNELVERKFNPNYDMKKHLPKQKGIEVTTNFAPMQRFVWAQGLGIITKGLTEYEIYKNCLNVTLLRSVGIISNPKNPARSTPAGPPIRLYDGQLLGKNEVEFSAGEFPIEQWNSKIIEIYPILE